MATAIHSNDPDSEPDQNTAVAPMADEVWLEEIRRDTRICDNCYRWIRDEIIREVRGANGLLVQRDTALRSHATHIQSHQTTYCGCGSGNHAERRPRSWNQLLHHAVNAVETLREKDYAVDAHAFLRRAAQLKRIPDIESKEDNEVLPRALHAGLHG